MTEEDFGIQEMQALQTRLQERYRDRWEPVCPESSRNRLLWMCGEVGEVIDIVKKHTPAEVCADPALRSHLVEELADVLMYYNDVLLSFGITAAELKQAYVEKFEKNMTRW